MKVCVEFSGGLESLFGGHRQMDLVIPDGLSSLKELILYLKENYLTGRADMFMDGDSLYCVLLA